MADAAGGEPLTPMVPLLTGWLIGLLSSRGRQDYEIRSLIPRDLDAVEIHFESGLVLRVRVEEVRGDG